MGQRCGQSGMTISAKARIERPLPRIGKAAGGVEAGVEPIPGEVSDDAAVGVAAAVGGF